MGEMYEWNRRYKLFWTLIVCYAFFVYQSIEEKENDSWVLQILAQIFEFQAVRFVHVGQTLVNNGRIDFDNFDL